MLGHWALGELALGEDYPDNTLQPGAGADRRWFLGLPEWKPPPRRRRHITPVRNEPEEAPLTYPAPTPAIRASAVHPPDFREYRIADPLAHRSIIEGQVDHDQEATSYGLALAAMHDPLLEAVVRFAASRMRQ